MKRLAILLPLLACAPDPDEATVIEESADPEPADTEPSAPAAGQKQAYLIELGLLSIVVENEDGSETPIRYEGAERVRTADGVGEGRVAALEVGRADQILLVEYSLVADGEDLRVERREIHSGLFGSRPVDITTHYSTGRAFLLIESPQGRNEIYQAPLEGGSFDLIADESHPLIHGQMGLSCFDHAERGFILDVNPMYRVLAENLMPLGGRAQLVDADRDGRFDGPPQVAVEDVVMKDFEVPR